MQARTYLNGSVKNGNIMRWSINPLIVYIAPMKFYSKPGEDAKFRKMVFDAFSTWSAASGGKLKFKVIPTSSASVTIFFAFSNFVTL